MSSGIVTKPAEVRRERSPSASTKGRANGQRSIGTSGKGTSSPPQFSRASVKSTSLWFCTNGLCEHHDHLTPVAAKDAKKPSVGVLHCPLCDTATLVAANEINLPPWYDHDAIRRNSNRPVEPIFPAQDACCCKGGSQSRPPTDPSPPVVEVVPET
ncbi:MAG TPA: hypothetical protein VN397_02770 [Candidatus Methylomirabilis sp.]|nr:hypothetical protein [Candidatus Methylomirabilis sp.]